MKRSVPLGKSWELWELVVGATVGGMAKNRGPLHSTLLTKCLEAGDLLESMNSSSCTKGLQVFCGRSNDDLEKNSKN